MSEVAIEPDFEKPSKTPAIPGGEPRLLSKDEAAGRILPVEVEEIKPVDPDLQTGITETPLSSKESDGPIMQYELDTEGPRPAHIDKSQYRR